MLAVAPAGDGAPVQDILLVGGIISAATIALLSVVVLYRSDRLPALDALGVQTERWLGMPGWAALPGLGAIGAAVVTFMGAIWDIGVHIDKGRDNGPFGTTAHYPLLVGLVLTYLLGILAVGMTPKDRRRSSAVAIELPALGAVPIGALLILAGGGFAMLGFPLDDLWHRVFGQDVTLWGPTHTMFFGGLITAACGAVVLMTEGVRSLGREPFGGWAVWKRPLPGVLGGVFLFVGTHATDEFNWAVPQYRQVWQPLLLAFFGAVGLVLARKLGGRGAVAGALLAYLPLQGIEVLLIGALGTTQPASVLYVAEALLVELVWWRMVRGGDVRRAVVCGVSIGTLGFAAEYAWSHLAMPLPWHAALLPEGVPSAVGGGVAGAVLAVLMAKALRGELAEVRRPLAVALGAAGLALALAVNAGISHAPATGATLWLTNPHVATTDGGGRTTVADLRVRLDRPELAEHGNWAYALGWQGDGRYDARLRRGADGMLRSTRPVPIGGDWKTFVRIHKGRTQLAVPIRMPADAALGFAGFPARPQVSRPMQSDTKLLQIERKDDGPMWAWTPAMLLVMALNGSLMALVGAASVRAGRAAVVHPPSGPRAGGAARRRRPRSRSPLAASEVRA